MKKLLIVVLPIIFFACQKRELNSRKLNEQFNRSVSNVIFSANTTNQKDIFQIGVYWNIPDSAASSKRILTDVKNANVDVIQDYSNMYMSNNYVMSVLKIANEVGLKMYMWNWEAWRSDGNITRQKGIIDSIKNNPAFEGYLVWDEPPASEIERAVAACQKIQQNDSINDTWINLLPTSDTAIIDSYVSIRGANNIKFLSTDFYAYNPSGLGTDIYKVLNTIRKSGLKYNLNTAFYLQSSGTYLHNNPANIFFVAPTSVQLRNNAYLALAYGIKYPIWFLYNIPIKAYMGDVHTYFAAISDSVGNKLPIYSTFQQLNGELHKLGNTLSHLDAMEVYFSGSDLTDKMPIIPTNFMWNSNDGGANNILISHLKDRHSNAEYILVLNRIIGNLVGSAITNMSFNIAPSITNITEISKTTGLEIPTSFNTINHTISLNFDPGDGRLFRIYK